MKNSLCVLCCIFILCVSSSMAFASEGRVSYRMLQHNGGATTFYTASTFEDGTPVSKQMLKEAFARMMAWKYVHSNIVSTYETYSIFKEVFSTWAGDNSATVTLAQYLYKNGKVLNTMKTTYIFDVQYSYDIEKQKHKIHCIVNDMAVENSSHKMQRIVSRYGGYQFWPPLAKAQDEFVLQAFNKEASTLLNTFVQYKKMEKYHYETITSLDIQFIRQMLRQQLPEKRTALRVTDDGVFWGDTPIVTVTETDGGHRITIDFDVHYTVTHRGRKVALRDAVPFNYLRETVAKSLSRGTYKQIDVQAINKYSMQEYLEHISGVPFHE